VDYWVGDIPVRWCDSLHNDWFDLCCLHRDTDAMQTVNRMAAIVTPREPFFTWSESVLGEEANECGPEDFRTVFLLPV